MKLSRKSRNQRLAIGVGFANTSASTLENKLRSELSQEMKMSSRLPVAALEAEPGLRFPGLPLNVPSLQLQKWLSGSLPLPPSN